ncbi:MAG: DUF2188 domain-containing protein [Candidatus Thermoplasmatota archaeon]|nr:DUF2188 domain-containing protein [Candidatus Thermoplasmatota archaeon]
MIERAGHKHILPTHEGWVVRAAGLEQASRIFQSREEAVRYSKEVAVEHNVCIVIHDEEGELEDFHCTPDVKNRFVMKKNQGWAVIAEGGNEVEKIFNRKGEAMAYAFDYAKKHNVCMLINDKDGNFKSKTCPPDGHPGILEVFRMKLKV